MWKLVLCFSVISSTGLAAGLIQVPDAAVEKGPISTTRYPANPGVQRASPLSSVISNDAFADIAERLPKKLDGAPQAEYEGYFNNMFEGMKKSSMQKLGVKIPVDVTRGIRCLDSAEAFGFERVSETEYKANCFAGTGKKITHVAEFKIHIDFIPAGCGTQAKIHTAFNDTAARTRMGAARFYQSIQKTCAVDAVAVNPMNPFSKITLVTTGFVTKTLEGNAELDKYVNGSHTTKEDNTVADEDYDSKHLKSVAKPSTRKQVSDDDEDDSKPEPTRCVSGNVLCKTSGAN
jgi:hypothetical protein